MKKLFSKAYWAEYFFPKHAEELALLRDEIRRRRAATQAR